MRPAMLLRCIARLVVDLLRWCIPPADEADAARDGNRASRRVDYDAYIRDNVGNSDA